MQKRHIVTYFSLIKKTKKYHSKKTVLIYKKSLKSKTALKTLSYIHKLSIT